MKTKKKTTAKRLTTVALAILSLVLVLLAPLLGIFAKDGGRYSTNTVRASAASLDYIKIESYDVTMKVNENRNINVEEIITVTFLRRGLTMLSVTPKTMMMVMTIKM